MRFVHISDLHLGKRVNEFPMLEDQKDILEKILNVIDAEKPHAVLVAGDVYDKSVPSAEAVQLFDDFLVKLSERSLNVFVISGNHDSAERIAFGSRLMDMSGVHMSPVYDGNVSPTELMDEHGTVRVYMLPFLRPANVRRFFEEEEIESYTDAVRAAVKQMEIDTGVRNVIVTHQFVTGASRCESEEFSVGGTDNVDASVFSGFDYVALGHIHGAQNIGSERIRYCGTPLKYSFSEKDHEKSVTVADLGKKGELEVRTVPLVPLHDMREIRGTYDELTLKKNYAGTNTDDYLRVVLTDENYVLDARAKLQTVYKNIMKLEYDNARTRAFSDITLPERTENRSEAEIFAEFYEKQNGVPMRDEQMKFTESLFRQLKEGSL